MVTITVVRPAGRGDFGDPIDPAEHTIDGFDISPRTSHRGLGTREPEELGETVVVGLTAYGPFDADILPTDQVRITGTDWDGLYDVIGEPGRWKNPHTGEKVGIEVALTRSG